MATSTEYQARTCATRNKNRGILYNRAKTKHEINPATKHSVRGSIKVDALYIVIHQTWAFHITLEPQDTSAHMTIYLRTRIHLTRLRK